MTTEYVSRKVLMSPELMDQWATRDVDGNLLRWDWRQPNGEIWELTVATIYADNLVAAERRRIAEAVRGARDDWMEPMGTEEPAYRRGKEAGFALMAAAVLALLDPKP